MGLSGSQNIHQQEPVLHIVTPLYELSKLYRTHLWLIHHYLLVVERKHLIAVTIGDHVSGVDICDVGLQDRLREGVEEQRLLLGVVDMQKLCQEADGCGLWTEVVSLRRNEGVGEAG